MAQNERDNQETKSSSENNPNRMNGGRNRLSLWIYLIVFLALLANFFIFLNGEEQNAVDFSVFLDHVEKGYVEEVVIIGDTRVEGRYTEQAVSERKVELPNSSRQDILGSNADEQRRTFVTTKSKEEPLSELLREKEVSFSYRLRE